MSLRPFFTYFGGKWRAARYYDAPTYPVLVEPFAGSAGYSLRYPDRQVMLYDLDERVAGTWDYLIHAPESEIASLPLMDGTWSSTDDLVHLPQEARWLIGWWLNKGTTTPGKTPSRWARETDDPGENFWGPGIRSRLERQVQHIRHWQVFHDTYAAAPSYLPATWFVDPPYEVAGKYRVRDVNFPALGDWCRSLDGQVMVCENEGATWLPFRPLRSIKATHGRGRVGVSHEAIWTNEEGVI